MTIRLKNKSTKYFLCLILTFLLIEIGLNAGAIIFSNLTDKVKLKSAMFNFRDDTEVLFLGSSRFKDGISPKIVMSTLNNSQKTKWTGFNGATTGTNIKRFEYFFNRIIEKKGLKLIVVEISIPQLTPGELRFDSQDPPTDIEGQLQHVFSNHLKIIDWRKSFRLENLKNAPAILAANYMEGSELYRSNVLKDFLSDDHFNFSSDLKRQWKPVTISPIANINLTDTLVSAIHLMSESAKKHDVDLLYVVPPLVNDKQQKESSNEIINLYQEIANSTGRVILDYSRLPLPEYYFRDKDSHLNKEGRYYFSTTLSSEIISALTKSEVSQ